MTTTKTTSRTNQQGKDQQVIQGIDQDLKQMTTLYLGGTTYTPTTLKAFVQSRIDAANQVATAKANWQAAAKTYEGINQEANVVIHDLKQVVIGAFGAQSVKLADFGWTPRKKVVLTPDQKVAAAAKRKATREARGTKGPKAKLGIKGTVPSATTTTGTGTPAAPAGGTGNQGQGQTAATTTAAAPSATPPAAAPAMAPAVTVNVTTAPAATPGATPAATQGVQVTQATQTPQPTAPPAATATATVPAKS